VEFSRESGPVVALKHLQKALGVTPTGTWGPPTAAAIRQIPPERLQAELVKVRIRYLAGLVMTQPCKVRFLGSWLERAIIFFPAGSRHAD